MYVRWPKQVECLRVESVRVCLCLQRTPDWLSACVMNASLLFVRIMVLRVVISIASPSDRHFSFSIMFYHVLSFFYHYLTFSIIIYHYLSFSFIFFHFLSFFFHFSFNFLSFSFFFLFLCWVLKICFFLGLNFVTISLDNSYAKIQFFGPSGGEGRVGGFMYTFGPSFTFFLLCFFLFWSFSLPFILFIFLIFCSFLHFFDF